MRQAIVRALADSNSTLCNVEVKKGECGDVLPRMIQNEMFYYLSLILLGRARVMRPEASTVNDVVEVSYSRTFRHLPFGIKEILSLSTMGSCVSAHHCGLVGTPRRLRMGMPWHRPWSSSRCRIRTGVCHWDCTSVFERAWRVKPLGDLRPGSLHK